VVFPTCRDFMAAAPKPPLTYGIGRPTSLLAGPGPAKISPTPSRHKLNKQRACSAYKTNRFSLL
jgi:hypothetical protein